MDYTALQALTEEQLRCARSLCYLLNKPVFQETYVRSRHKDQLIKCIREHNYVGVHAWWKREIIVDVELLTVKELRQLASFYSIEDYHILRKSELQEEILNARASTTVALRDDLFVSESDEEGNMGEESQGVNDFDFGAYLSSFVGDQRNTLSRNTKDLDANERV